MQNVFREIERFLFEVEKPSRYIGGEWNAIRKNPEEVKLKLALCFPDLYEIGMSHLGLKILYNLLNSDREILAERVFVPWIDMQSRMRQRKISLFSLENHLPLSSFDVVGFSVQYELNYTNILSMLDLGGILLRSGDRNKSSPIIIAGGPALFNPEPLVPFIDLFFIGDGEESIMEFVNLFKRLRLEGAGRADIIEAAARMEGVYVPSLTIERKAENGFVIPAPSGSTGFPIHRRLTEDIGSFPFPEDVVVPHCEIIHDRVSYEIMRGCLTGCRFCQAGYIYRPRRERNPERVKEAVRRSVAHTGYEEASLTSLNSGEYNGIGFLLSSLMEDFSKNFTSLSLPSLRPSSLTEEIIRQIKRVRKTGFTIAPEAATARLKAVINKNIEEEQVLTAADLAFREGWELLKLYFIIGLPTETEDDIKAIAGLVHKISKRVRVTAGRGGRINVSISSFVPKPHTPFQWLPMERVEELERKQKFLKRELSSNFVRIKWHDTKMSFMEAVFSRGDRRLSDVIERAFKLGCQFDGWSDRFNFSLWKEAFISSGINPEEYAYRRMDVTEPLPWDIIDTGVKKSFLAGELDKAMEGRVTPICNLENCYACGSFVKECKEIMKKSESAKGGSAIYNDAMKSGPPHELSKANTGNVPEYRYRIKYEKKGKSKFLSHLDLIKTIIRALRRAGIPIAYSRGFSPKARIAFGPALPLGLESSGEYFDFHATEYIDEERFLREINHFLPEGLSMKKLKIIHRKTPSLSETLNLALYIIQPEEPLLESSVWRSIEDFRHLKEHGSGGDACGSERFHEMAGSIKELSYEKGKWIRLLVYIAGDGKARIGDILKNFAGDERTAWRVEREEMFMEKNGRLYSPYLLAKVD
ncbi:MAG: TIGR03960 family B12-binding radical SAM protein [Acidobacteriota bacterium]